MNTTRKFLLAAMVGGSAIFLTGQKEASPAKTAPSLPAVFTAAQAMEGQTAYLSTCAKCHLETLLGRTGDARELPPIASLPKGMQEVIQSAGGQIPPLAGARFMSRWNAQTTSALSLRIRDAVGGFRPEGATAETYLHLTAYILQANGARAGATVLTKDTAVEIRWVMTGVTSPQTPAPPAPRSHSHQTAGSAEK